MQSFKELIVWQKAMSLVEEVYKLMSFLPANENMHFLIRLDVQLYRSHLTLQKAEGVILKENLHIF